MSRGVIGKRELTRDLAALRDGLLPTLDHVFSVVSIVVYLQILIRQQILGHYPGGWGVGGGGGGRVCGTTPNFPNMRQVYFKSPDFLIF